MCIRDRFWGGLFLFAFTAAGLDVVVFAITPLALIAPFAGLTIVISFVFATVGCCGVRENPTKTSLVAVDDMRVAVAADSLSLYVAGQEDAPLLAGELHGRLDPARCSWTVAARAALVPGAAAAGGDDDGAREIEITLRKATAADWPDLIKTWYV